MKVVYWKLRAYRVANMWRKLLKPISVIATAINPVAGAVLGVASTIVTKTKEKTVDKINGKKAYVGITVTVLAFIAKLLGYDVPIETTEGLTTSLNEIVMSVSSAIAAIGFAHKIEKIKK